MKTSPLVLAGVLAFAGCASVSLPPEAAVVNLVPVSSPDVEVHRPRFHTKEGELKLEAYAFRRFKAETTANTHIDLVFLDRSGRELRQELTYFTPRSLPPLGRMPHPAAYLRVPVRIPAGTATIEVRAHEGAH